MAQNPVPIAPSIGYSATPSPTIGRFSMAPSSITHQYATRIEPAPVPSESTDPLKGELVKLLDRARNAIAGVCSSRVAVSRIVLELQRIIADA